MGPRARIVTGRGALVVPFVCLLTMGAAWALGVPVFSAPDEHAHVIRAAGLVRGDLVGDGAVTPVVRAPAIYQRSQTFLCYVHQPTVPADCAPAFTGPTTPSDVATLAGRYPPLYYLLVGLPSAPFPSVSGLYLMRILSAAWMALLLTGALRALLALRRPAWPLAGFAVAVTPMVVYLGGAVNPNGFEIAAAICLWCSGLALREHAGGPRAPGLVHAAGASACTLVLCRGLSPLWLGLIGLFLIALLRGRPLAALLRERTVRAWLAAIVACSLVAVAWIARTGLVPGTTADLALTERLRLSTGRTPTFLAQAIGNFGFLDAPAPALTLLLWGLVAGALLVLALVTGAGRVRNVLLAVLATSLVLPVVLEVAQTNAIGLFWQGRYQLPVMVAVPLLAAAAIRAGAPPLDASRWWLLPAAAATAHVAAYAWVVRRYAVGTAGPVNFVEDAPWTPPLPAPLLLVAFAAAAAALAVWLVAQGRTPSGDAAPVPEVAA